MLRTYKPSFNNPLTGFSTRVRAGLRLLPTFGGLRTITWIAFGLLLVAVVYLAQFSNAALLANSLRTKQARIEELGRENAQLEYEIAAATAPSSIEARAQALGLGPATNVIYANLPSLNAARAEVVPVLPSPPVTLTEQDLAVTVPSPWDQILTLFGLGGSTDRAQAQGK